MKKTKYVLLLLLLFSCVLTYEGWKAEARSVIVVDKTLYDENRLKELRAKVKILFPDVIDYGKISPKHFEKDKNYSVFTIRFSNIIYESGSGKLIKVPIFRGTMGDVLYDDFLKYCETKRLLKGHTEAAFEVKFKKGEYNKVLNEFWEFYGRHLSINFKDVPAEMFPYSEREQVNVYTFTLDGVACELSFYYLYDEYVDEATKLEYVIRIIE